jgi:protein ImuB
VAQDLRHITRLIAEHLAQQTLPAPVHSLSLTSLSTELLADSAAATQSLLLSARQQGDSAVELLERLSARLGDAQVLAWLPGADHRPERMQRWISGRAALPGLRPVSGKTRKRAKTAEVDAAVRTDALYPSWLLPEPLKLATAGNHPVYQGKLLRLAGPQRLEASGWLMAGEGPNDSIDRRASPPAMRDYYIYRSEQAGLLWIYSERLALDRPENPPRQAWYLHGFFA